MPRPGYWWLPAYTSSWQSRRYTGTTSSTCGFPAAARAFSSSLWGSPERHTTTRHITHTAPHTGDKHTHAETCAQVNTYTQKKTHTQKKHTHTHTQTHRQTHTQTH